MLHRSKSVMRTVLTCSGVLFAAGISSGLTSALAADPTGDWRVADGVADIRVAQCGSSMWGVVAWEKTPGGRDTNNPDVSKQNRPTLGMPILIDMKKTPGADQWEGQVYNAKDGQLYSSTITPTDPEHLEIKGCVLGFLCGGETWTRVGPPIPSSLTNSMAKGTSKPPAPAPKTAAPPAAPKTAGAASSPAKPGQKSAAAEHIGDICLLPEVAGYVPPAAH
jgi:uncharacterized protein (DUF2147 family)